MTLPADDAETLQRMAAFKQGLQELGWTEGRNVRIDYRWAAGEDDRFRRYAAELVALAPDVILSSGASAAAPLQQATDAGEIERAIAAFTRGSDGGMIVTASTQAQIHRNLIITPGHRSGAMPAGFGPFF
jgi:hypothetical protein